MHVEQIKTIINSITNEVLGSAELLNEDLSNCVDVGTQLFDAESVDNYVKSLVNHIGRVVFVDRKYSGTAPSVLMDGWEFGSVMEKISMDSLPEASENSSWELTDGTEYSPNTFHKPTVSAKFFNKRVTFEIDMSFTDKQVKESFSNVQQLNAFMSMIYTQIDNSMTVKLDSLIMRTLNNAIAETVYSEYPEGTYTASSGVRAVNLLKLYNDELQPATALTAEKAITSPEFIRFAVYQMNMYISRLERMSTLFNVGNKPRFTSKDKLHLILHSQFKSGADIYLQSDTFNEEYTALPASESVPYWQGSGTKYEFSSTSKIDVKTPAGHTVALSGIIGMMFDRYALGVTNMDRRVTTQWNPKGEFTNNFYKYDAGYFNDFNENVVVFFVA